ncbi:MAG: LytTR family DNA-binding domain-containing protein [Roseburia sp.]|nr:LytTR family DNA-binding domain-containing protein [Roseburia sp.]MCM1279353.1 LytTR family DNA-binding domain-containing protein [Robinsoniella sp.]
MEHIRVAIVDNELLFTNVLKKMSAKILEKTVFSYNIDTYESAESLLTALSSTAYDLFFLDILLDGMNGMELARKIRQKADAANIVFITSSSDYAVESYEVAPLHYLVKPVTMVNLEEAFRRFFDAHGEAAKEETVLLKDTSNQKVLLPISDIYYAEIMESKITLHTKEGILFLRGRMDDLQKSLPDEHFYRCHRSFLVNFQHVTGSRRYDFITKDGSFVPIAKGNYRTAVKAFTDYIER